MAYGGNRVLPISLQSGNELPPEGVMNGLVHVKLVDLVHIHDRHKEQERGDQSEQPRASTANCLVEGRHESIEPCSGFSPKCQKSVSVYTPH